MWGTVIEGKHLEVGHQWGKDSFFIAWKIISIHEQIDLTSLFQIMWLSYRYLCHPNCLIQWLCKERSLRPPSADCMTNPKGNANRDGPGPGGNSIILRGWGGGKPRVSNSQPAFEPLPLGWENSSRLLIHILLPNILPVVLPDSGFSFYPWSYYFVLIWHEI